MININRKLQLLGIMTCASGLFFLSTGVFGYGNELATGQSSKVNGPIDISINPMVSLNFKSRDEILAMRKKLVSAYPELLNKEYSPSKVVFDSIESGKPWWGIIGCTVYGAGKNSILGPSEESRFLLNPFMLVGISSWSNEIWDKEKLTGRELEREDFPFCWSASIVRFYPERKLIQVGYEVTRYNQSLEKYKPFITDQAPVIDFGLIAYNARDFGYEYLYVPMDKCKNIGNQAGPVNKAIKIQQYIHCGGSSGYPGGSNNMSPGQPEIDHFLLEKLPARMTVKLWQKSPSRVEDEADLTVYLELR